MKNHGEDQCRGSGNVGEGDACQWPLAMAWCLRRATVPILNHTGSSRFRLKNCNPVRCFPPPHLTYVLDARSWGACYADRSLSFPPLHWSLSFIRYTLLFARCEEASLCLLKGCRGSGVRGAGTAPSQLHEFQGKPPLSCFAPQNLCWLPLKMQLLRSRNWASQGKKEGVKQLGGLGQRFWEASEEMFLSLLAAFFLQFLFSFQ